MKNLTYNDINNHLQSLQTIYQTLGVTKQKMRELEHAIHVFNEYGDTPLLGMKSNSKVVSNKSKKRMSFDESLQMINQKRYQDLEGTKMNYEDMNTSQQIIEYIDQTTKAKVLRETTALDLKLLYSILTGKAEEIKGTKSTVYDDIKGYIRAKKRGVAFAGM